MRRDKRGFYGIDGENFRSSTTILRFLEKEGLHPWIAWTSAKKVRELVIDPLLKGEMTMDQLREMDIENMLSIAAKAHSEERDTAGDMGSLIHKVIEEYYKDKSNPLVLDNYTKTIPELTAPILAFISWQAKYKIVPINSEHTVFSRLHRYAGTLDLDCIAKINDSTDRIVVDFKSSSSIYDEHILQLASYVFAQMEMSGHPYSGGMIVRLDKETGMPDEHYYPLKDLMSPFKMFLAIKGYCDARDEWMAIKKASRSSKAEQAPYKGQVVGSSPTGTTEESK